MENKWREIRQARYAWRLRRQRHIGSSCDSLNLLALHHARLLSRSGTAAFGAAAFGRSTEGRGTADDAACGRAGASGAAATFLSMRFCRRSVASHARLLARSGAAACCGTAAAPLAARPPAAPAPPAPLSAFFGRTAVLPNPASLAGDDASAARYTPQRTRPSKWSFKGPFKIMFAYLNIDSHKNGATCTRSPRKKSGTLQG